ncbi:small ribosomal subunit protein mS23 [Neosynchiropus ocellatus]
MAGSRLEKLGSVFSRVRNLMISGVLKPKEKPLWYDVYEAFPPKREPLYVKPHPFPPTQKADPVPAIFYSEDVVRAKYFRQYRSGPWAFNLLKSNFVSTSQRFVDTYEALKSSTDLDEAALFEETGKSLLKEGIVLRRRGAAPVSEEQPGPLAGVGVSDVMDEQVTDAADGVETPPQSTHS